MNRIGKLFSIGAAALALAACTSEDPRNKPKIDVSLSSVPSNDVTLTASDTGVLLDDATAMSAGFSGLSGGVTVFGAGDGTGRLGLKALVDRAAAARKQAGISVAGVAQTDGGACPVSGTVRITVEDADGDPATTTSGDYVEIAADDCGFDDGTAIDGTLRMTFTSSGGDFVTDPYDPYFDPYASASFAFTITVSDFTEWYFDGTFSAMDGSMTVTWSQDAALNQVGAAITGPYLITALGNSSGAITSASALLEPTTGAGYSFESTQTYDDSFMNLAEEAFAINAKVCSTEEGGCLTVTMNPAMAQRTYDLHPYAGNLRFQVGVNWLQLDVVDATSVQVSYFIGGVSYTGTATWACLDTATDSSSCFVP
jgi:hypothetical protein